MKLKKDKRKRSKKFIKELEKNFTGIVFIVSLGILIFSVYSFVIGFHNMDLAYNIRGLNAEYDIELIDHTSKGNYLTDYEIWNLGFEQIKFGFFGMFISGFILSPFYFMWFKND